MMYGSRILLERRQRDRDITTPMTMKATAVAMAKAMEEAAAAKDRATTAAVAAKDRAITAAAAAEEEATAVHGNQLNIRQPCCFS